MNFIYPELISRVDLCKLLGISVSTINRRVKAGKLPKPFTVAGGGVTSRVYFNRDDIKVLMRPPAMPEDVVDKASEHAQFHEIERRIRKIAPIIGMEPIKKALAEFDEQYVDALHPRHYPAFRTKLAQLTIKRKL